MNLTLVAYYGREKPTALQRLITIAQETLIRNLGKAFEPYHPDQVHATIIGLEGTRIGDMLINTNYLRICQQSKIMQLQKVTEILRDPSILPIHIQIGGYQAGVRYPFTSRGLHPYLRSFSIQGDLAVAIGWPVIESGTSLALDQLRRKMCQANVLHKYHVSPGEIDNDFFFILGRIKQSTLQEADLRSIQDTVRSLFAKQAPTKIDIDRQSLAFVAYTDPKLPLDSSKIFRLNQAENNLEEIIRLYQELPVNSNIFDGTR